MDMWLAFGGSEVEAKAFLKKSNDYAIVDTAIFAVGILSASQAVTKKVADAEGRKDLIKGSEQFWADFESEVPTVIKELFKKESEASR